MLVVVGAVVILLNNSSAQNLNTTSSQAQENTNNTNTTQQTQPVRQDASEAVEEDSYFEADGTVSRATVSNNDTIDSCLVIYSNKVYEIPSSWASQHPGGSAEITNNCGIDITNLFNSVGDHNSNAERMLQDFYLAELSN